eukprot:TRINITY_DN115_c0_g1_i2.p1 TRINITY_DN115_c0_g1~~TRINITY_DN115_c0_g1_i2.p1  ORF type:complete len:437 (-),score=63.82 TRINITY_DN115_c0_g1_i2:357-1667(-)
MMQHRVLICVLICAAVPLIQALVCSTCEAQLRASVCLPGVGGICNCPLNNNLFCDGSCFSGNTDAEHCGSCGNNCAAAYPCTVGTSCQDGNCVAGTPKICPPSGPCGTSSCNPLTGECETSFVTAGTVCRASAGACDQAEVCTGASAQCPADTFVAAGTTCRSSSDVCDAAEQCNGVSAQCPADSFIPAGTVCRASAGVCDTAEMCTGASPSCPNDARVAAGTVCRSSAGPCDVADACNGVNPGCPSDSFVAAGTVCRASAGVCDTAEMCTGASPSCPNDARVAAGTVCRSSAGPCDVAEACNGVNPSCPNDGFVTAGTTCRASTGVCDPAETCTGSQAACPANVINSGADPKAAALAACQAMFGGNCADTGAAYIGFTGSMGSNCSPPNEWRQYCYINGPDTYNCNTCQIGAIKQSHSPCTCGDNTPTIGTFATC